MAAPFDSLAASIADVIDRLAKGEITEAQAAALLAPLLALVSDGDYGAKVEQVVGVLGRVSGMIIVPVTPPATRPSNLIGAPGGFAWDPTSKVFYGPKDAVTGWPAAVSMTQGPAGPALQMQVTATHIQWRVVGTSTWNNLIALSTLKGADGQQVSLQRSATHIQWRLGTGAWADLIPVADLIGPDGLSAKQTVINAGLLPDGATDAQFATWLADAQIAKVQPLVDAAGVSVAEASSASTAAQTAATAATEARTGAVAAQEAVAADRQVVATDKIAVAEDRAAVEASALAASGHADDAASAAGVSVAAKDLAEGAASAAGVNAAATADDAQATAADRQAVATDRAASEVAAVVATTQAGEAAGHAGEVDTARVAAESAQARAEQARDEAEAIAGGDFVTGPTSSTDGRLAVFAGTSGKAVREGPALGVGTAGDVLRRSDGDGRYRAAGDVPMTDVAGLANALDGKQNNLGFTPADAADTYTKDEVDAALDALPDPPAVPTFATVAEVRAGAAAGKIISPKVMADALATVVIARADAAIGINFSTFINAQIVLDANGTLGAPSSGYPGQSGIITVSNASGSATLAYNAAARLQNSQ